MKKLYDHMLKIAIAITEKRHEDESSLDIDIRFLLSLAKYVSSKNYDGSYFLPADEVAQFVNDDVKPHFKMRTESFGRKWDKESLITRGYTSVRDENGMLHHKRAWLIDVKRLNRRVEKYSRFLPTPEQLERQETEGMLKDLQKNSWENLSEDEKRKTIAGIGKPKDW
jgi:hypothetical protein